MDDILTRIISPCLSDEDIFKSFIDRFDYISDNTRQNGSITTISHSTSNNILKGKLFELLCFKLIRGGCFRKITSDREVEVWLYPDLPAKLRDELKLPYHSRDMGIDIVCRDQNGWIAVQCKYRKKPSPHAKFNRGWKLPWKDLSTFYALCNTSGPWMKTVVITTGLGILRQGRRKLENEVAICNGSFKSLPREAWLWVCGDEGNILDKSKSGNNITMDELRNTRLKWISNIKK